MALSARTGLLFLAFALTLPAAAPPGIKLIARGNIPGTGTDKSGLGGDICSSVAPGTCIPKTTFGGFGSGLTYTGHDNVFIAVPDRGPFDGLTDVPYIDRFHFLTLRSRDRA